MSMTGAEIIVDCLIQEQVEVLFGYPGGVVLPIFDALYDAKKIRVILTRHEQGAAHAADGYSRATGKVGVCLATSGPGATNLVTGIATAFMDSIPLVAITGQVSSSLLGTDAFQEVDIIGISRSITKHNFLVTHISELAQTIKKAFYIASTGRPGPVLIDIPVDVSKDKLESYTHSHSVHMRGYKPTIHGHKRQLDKALECISTAQKPVVYAGGGIIHADASAELFEFITKTRIPIMTTLMGLGTFPMNHPLFIGMPGMHGTKSANLALQNADLIISLGVRFDDRVTGNISRFAPFAKIIHVDIDPATIEKIVAVAIPVVSDAKYALQQLLRAVKTNDLSPWHQQIESWKSKSGLPQSQHGDSLKPQQVVEALCELTDGNAVVTTEVGQNQMWTAQFYKFNAPRTFLSSGGLGTMGFGLPAAMGAALGLKKSVIAIAGDGSIQMNIQELATISLNRIPVKIIILNNQYLGMVRQWQELFFQRRYSSTCLKADVECNGKCSSPHDCQKPYIPDFIGIAKAYGIPAFRVTSAEQVHSTLKTALSIDGPVLCEFIVERQENVFPMVAAGNAIDQIMEGV